jgi:hypothetical protein
MKFLYDFLAVAWSPRAGAGPFIYDRPKVAAPPSVSGLLNKILDQPLSLGCGRAKMNGRAN